MILEKKKLIIFWSPKCGCTTLKTILSHYFNLDNKINVHKSKFLNFKTNNQSSYKKDVKYDILFLIRNPYDRLVSGFVDKYVTGKLKNPKNCNNFEDFVNILLNTPNKIEYGHFTKQTSNKGWEFYKKLGKPKIKYVLETHEVNKMSDILQLNLQDIHRMKSKWGDKVDKAKLFACDYKTVLNTKGNFSVDQFYNNEIKRKVSIIYKDDFNFFKNVLKKDFYI